MFEDIADVNFVSLLWVAPEAQSEDGSGLRALSINLVPFIFKKIFLIKTLLFLYRVQFCLLSRQAIPSVLLLSLPLGVTAILSLLCGRVCLNLTSNKGSN